jgi:hypothetical protein
MFELVQEAFEIVPIDVDIHRAFGPESLKTQIWSQPWITSDTAGFLMPTSFK